MTGRSSSSSAHGQQSASRSHGSHGSHGSPAKPYSAATFGPYRLGRTVGEGEFSKVKLAYHPDAPQLELAIKFIKKQPNDNPARREKQLREIRILKALNHPHIVKLYDVMETDQYIAMVMNYASDIWSCGVILFAMLAGYLPYDDDPANPDSENITLLYKYILETEPDVPEYVSADAKDLILCILVPDPRYRATMAEIKAHR
eukprot:jgi/Hompol1/1903/HPOL_004989-RA